MNSNLAEVESYYTIVAQRVLFEVETFGDDHSMKRSMLELLVQTMRGALMDFLDRHTAKLYVLHIY